MTTTNTDEPQIAVPTAISDVAATKTPTQFRWTQTLELGYVEQGPASDVESLSPICFHCGKESTNADGEEEKKLSKCARCQVASYW